jgi:hypothetical protein
LSTQACDDVHDHIPAPSGNIFLPNMEHFVMFFPFFLKKKKTKDISDYVWCTQVGVYGIGKSYLILIFF